MNLKYCSTEGVAKSSLANTKEQDDKIREKGCVHNLKKHLFKLTNRCFS